MQDKKQIMGIKKFIEQGETHRAILNSDEIIDQANSN